MLCAWAKGKDACQGDSGGPLTVAENGKIYSPSFVFVFVYIFVMYAPVKSSLLRMARNILLHYLNVKNLYMC